MAHFIFLNRETCTVDLAEILVFCVQNVSESSCRPLSCQPSSENAQKATLKGLTCRHLATRYSSSYHTWSQGGSLSGPVAIDREMPPRSMAIITRTVQTCEPPHYAERIDTLVDSWLKAVSRWRALALGPLTRCIAAPVPGGVTQSATGRPLYSFKFYSKEYVQTRKTIRICGCNEVSIWMCVGEDRSVSSTCPQPESFWTTWYQPDIYSIRAI
jgi:hypothetical protein